FRTAIGGRLSCSWPLRWQARRKKGQRNDGAVHSLEGVKSIARMALDFACDTAEREPANFQDARLHRGKEVRENIAYVMVVGDAAPILAAIPRREEELVSAIDTRKAPTRRRESIAVPWPVPPVRIP
ncbi:hypothetical protein FOZ63_015897, partial [Perkinsus olseni]